MRYSVIPYPAVSRDAADILRLFGPESEPAQRAAIAMLGARRNYLGCDLEFDEQENPSILGVSDGHLHVSVPYGEGIELFKELVKKHNPVFVGHFFTTADLFVFRKAGINIDLVDIQDTMVWHYLCNLHLCKTIKKSKDGDGEKRGRGYMNLWAFISLYTTLPNWKEHRGPDCTGPCPECDVYAYNGLDSLSCLWALPEVVKQARIRGVSKLYDMHRDLAYVLTEMSRYGIQSDVKYTDSLREELLRDKAEIASELPFNPESWQQTLKYFREEKELAMEDTSEETVRKMIDGGEDDPMLQLFLEYKELGDGADRWFAPQIRNKKGELVGYVDSDGRIHCRAGFFTSSARLQISSPNMQNLPNRRIDRHNCVCSHKDVVHKDGVCQECECKKFTGINLGRKIRRGVIASPGKYLLKADESNAENRAFLHQAGYELDRNRDLHTWVAEIAKLTPDMEFVKVNKGKPREAAKTIQHAGNYEEGLQLKTEAELRSERMRQEVKVGARIVYPKWTFEGKIVTFTGANLAQRAFGSKTWENRRKALEIAERYFGAFPLVRALQQRINTQMEKEKATRTPLGYYTLALGDAEERMKTSCAIFGSQPVAHFTKLALIDMWRKFEAGRKMRPILQVHDEILCEVDQSVPPIEALAWMKESMEIEVPELPGLIIPIDAAWSDFRNGSVSNWRDMQSIKA